MNLTAKTIFCSLLTICLMASACSDDSGSDSAVGDMTIKDSNSPPGPDGQLPDAKAPDAGLPDAHGTVDLKAPDAKASKDSSAADFYFTNYKCGAKSTCTPSQYCHKMTPGVPGGYPMGDAGVCPPDCTPSGKPGYCTCLNYTCKARPAGCNSCACMPKIPGCTCVYSASKGGMLMDCYAP